MPIYIKSLGDVKFAAREARRCNAGRKGRKIVTGVVMTLVGENRAGCEKVKKRSARLSRAFRKV